MSARLNIRDDGDVIVIDAYGKLATGQERHSLHAQLRRLAVSGRKRILLNLAALPSMDSADIGELMAGHAAIAMAGGVIKLLSPLGQVADILRETQITKLMDAYPNEASAIMSFTDLTPRLRMAARNEPRSEWYYG